MSEAYPLRDTKQGVVRSRFIRYLNDSMYQALSPLLCQSLSQILYAKLEEENGVFVPVRPFQLSEELVDPGYMRGEDFYEKSLKVPGWGALVGHFGKKNAASYWTYKKVLARVAREVIHKLREDKEIRRSILMSYDEDLQEEMRQP